MPRPRTLPTSQHVKGWPTCLLSRAAGRAGGSGARRGGQDVVALVLRPAGAFACCQPPQRSRPAARSSTLQHAPARTRPALRGADAPFRRAPHSQREDFCRQPNLMSLLRPPESLGVVLEPGFTHSVDCSGNEESMGGVIRSIGALLNGSGDGNTLREFCPQAMVLWRTVCLPSRTSSCGLVPNAPLFVLSLSHSWGAPPRCGRDRATSLGIGVHGLLEGAGVSRTVMGS